MDPLPTIEDILQETQDAMQSVFNSTVTWRDRYGHVVFTQALQTNTLLKLIEWAQSGNPNEPGNAELIAALAKIAEAIHRG